MDGQTLHSPLSHFDATPLLDSLALPVLVLDGDCCVVYVNRAARALLCLGLRELQGQPLDLLFAHGQLLRSSLSRMLTDARPGSARPLRLTVHELAQPARRLALKAQVIDDELTGPHLLVQLARARQRRLRPVVHLLPRPDIPVEAASQLECA
jgi:nitrogen-specific signal transduction histidine kinase